MSAEDWACTITGEARLQLAVAIDALADVKLPDCDPVLVALRVGPGLG